MISKEDVLKLAGLARLDFSDEELDRIIKDMDDIIAFADTINNAVEGDAEKIRNVSSSATPAEDFREDIVKEFARILKPNGKISIVKHNRAGRVMQMVVLLNDFEHAHSLLDGTDGMASKYGAIYYYEDTDIEQWCPELAITKALGMRTFWDMQQNQEIHKNADWQDKMVEIEMRVSDMDGYKDIAFFHHLMIEKR